MVATVDTMATVDTVATVDMDVQVPTVLAPSPVHTLDCMPVDQCSPNTVTLSVATTDIAILASTVKATLTK